VLSLLKCQKSKKRTCKNIIFIGHVDSGKSTITGQILQQTGMLKNIKTLSSCKINFLQQAIKKFLKTPHKNKK
jgi:translation elongation factor EF-1alpha